MKFLPLLTRHVYDGRSLPGRRSIGGGAVVASLVRSTNIGKDQLIGICQDTVIANFIPGIIEVGCVDQS